MTPNKSAKPKAPPDQTLEEAKYLRYLADNGVPVRIRLRNGEEVSGVIEFFDTAFLRLTRENGPNLFIYKHDIRYLHEEES